MAVIPTFSMDSVRNRMNAFLDAVGRQQIARLQELGEMCVTYARQAHPNNWEDQTGNLRSSTGYMVFVDGIAVHQSAFDQVQPKKPLAAVYNGGETGERLCRMIGEETEGVCLVVVAGMNYARHVESMGRDVLTGAEHLAERELPRMIEQLTKNIKDAVE